jgi:hypothetical protein
MKTGRTGGNFADREESFKGIRDILDGILAGEFIVVFKGWIDRMR